VREVRPVREVGKEERKEVKRKRDYRRGEGRGSSREGTQIAERRKKGLNDRIKK